MADIATIAPPTGNLPRRFRLPHGAAWPVSLLSVAILVFIYNYVDTYFGNAIPGPVHDLFRDWLPIRSINESLIYVLAALGLNIVVGYAGLLDLGYVAFWAIGGYVAGWLMSDFINGTTFDLLTSKFAVERHLVGIHISWWLVLIAAALVCALAGVVVGAPTLRLRSDYLALVTLGFGEIIPQFFYNGDDIFGHNLTNGSKGIAPVDSVTFFGFDNTGKLVWKDLGPFDVLPKFVIYAGLVALVMFASLRIREGKLGRAWLAIREDELAASAMGVPLMRTKLSAYSIGAVAGALAGAAYAVHISGVIPDTFNFAISINLLAMVVLGGMGNIWGVTVGALLLSWINSTGLPGVQKGLTEHGSAPIVGLWLFVVGLLILGIGLAGILAKFAKTLILVFLGVLVTVIGVLLIAKGAGVSFQFLVFGSVLVMMMLFRREGLIPEARTRLVLREPGRTEAEALGADMEDNAPELEALSESAVHGGHAGSDSRDGAQS